MAAMSTVGKRWLTTAVTNPSEALARLANKAEFLFDPILHRDDAGSAYARLLRAKPFQHGDLMADAAWEPEFEEIWSSMDFSPVDGGHAHDADPSLAMAVYAVVRSSDAVVVVETGVARGVTSRVILEALACSERAGTLISVDLPPLAGTWEEVSRSAVPESRRGAWTYLRGTARQVLPRVAKRYPQWDVFVHDSGHTYRNMKYEFELAKSRLRRDGWLISDDIEGNSAFRDLLEGDPRFATYYLEGRDKQNLVGIAQRVK